MTNEIHCILQLRRQMVNAGGIYMPYLEMDGLVIVDIYKWARFSGTDHENLARCVTKTALS